MVDKTGSGDVQPVQLYGHPGSILATAWQVAALLDAAGRCPCLLTSCELKVSVGQGGTFAFAHDEAMMGHIKDALLFRLLLYRCTVALNAFPHLQRTSQTWRDLA